MSPFQIISAFRSELDTSVRSTIALASQSAAGGDEKWDAYMESQGATPKTKDERAELLSLKDEPVKGALPIEVRAILEKHKGTANKKLESLKEQYGKEDWWVRVEEPIRKLIHDFIEGGIKTYIGETSSKTISTSAIFKNSMETTPKYYSTITTAGTKSEKCPTCMAARPEGSDLNTCAFCGTPIFTS